MRLGLKAFPAFHLLVFFVGLILQRDSVEKLRCLNLVVIKSALDILEAPDELLSLIAERCVCSAELITILVQLGVHYVLVWNSDIAGGLLKVHGTYVAERSV